MGELWKTVLSLSVSGTAVILVLFCFSRIFGRRLSRRWQYYIWLVAAARLLLPFSGEINLVGNAFAQLETRSEQWETKGTDTEQSAEAGEEKPEQKIASGEEEPAAEGEVPLPEVTSGYRTALQQPDVPDRLTAAAGMIWLAAASGLFFWKITAYSRFAGRIRAGSQPAKLPLLEQFGRIKEKKEIRGTVELYVNKSVSAPFLMGCLRPRVILPERAFSEKDFYYTALHELTHFQRRDLFYKWLVQLLICLHWFNPFVLFLGRETDRACELSCDEAVLDGLLPEERRAYGDTLLHAAAGAGGFLQGGTGVVTMHRGGRLLKGRLEAVTGYRKRSGPVRFLSVVLAVAVAAGAAVLGAYAQPGREAPRFSSGGNDFLLTDGTEVIQRDQVFYILCDGLTEEDVLPAGAVDGTLIVAVHKDRQTAVLLSGEQDDLWGEAEEICRQMQKRGDLSEQDALRVTETARELQKRMQSDQQENAPYSSFIQSVFYQEPYLFYVGYDLTEEDAGRYTGRVLTLEDGEQLYVSFADADRGWAENEEFLEILSVRFSEFRKRTGKRWAVIRRPIVSQIEYVGNDVKALAARYHAEEDRGRFHAVLLKLDTDSQSAYLEQAFTEDDAAVFSIALSCLYKEDALLDGAQIDLYASRAYREQKTALFSILVSYMSREMQQTWYRTLLEEEGKWSPFTIILQSELYDSEDDIRENEW